MTPFIKQQAMVEESDLRGRAWTGCLNGVSSSICGEPLAKGRDFHANLSGDFDQSTPIAHQITFEFGRTLILNSR